MRQQQAYLEAIDNSIQNQQLRVQKAKEVVNEKRANLNEAAVDRKIMQDFKEKCIQKYRQEFLKEEQKLFDELGVIGFNSKAN
ncbi:flagellar export protein FliJ [Desulfonispora thiosulfatigenes DSM 11270]|uniref:Flagellar FliJ protein n=1 Tax=Desulfonispora thiosulfatigenes DSM 11270 TaxID=656914 RepID=A0A1W1UN10_DESTI|nr:flagellar export protein FliJ [Desulfonispora thiosulfatigenes DSM 11270]